MILLLDAYDSFSHNLAHLFRAAGAEDLRVERHDRLTVDQTLDAEPRAIVLSPGPGRPGDRGITLPIVRASGGRIPILGVCLGHQAIGEAFGMRLRHAPRPVHGEEHEVRHTSTGVFRGLPSALSVMRYHSLILDETTLCADLEVTATLGADPDVIMGVRHRTWPIEGVQFHPESFLSPDGPRLIENFLASLA